MHTPAFIVYLKYVSIFNYGFDLLMVNQWENIPTLKCEYDVEILCLSSGPAVIEELKIYSVSAKTLIFKIKRLHF